MDATLLELPLPIVDSDHESELVGLVRSLRQEVAELRREVVDLRQQAHYWQTMHARAVEKGEKRQREIDQLRGENRQLKDRLYGIKSEKRGGCEHSFRIEDLAASEQTPKRRRGHQPQAPGPRRRDFSHLPVVEQPLTLPSEQCVCPQCGKPFVAMTDSEDSEVIEIDVRPYRRRIRRRRYRSTCGCPGVPRTLAAPLPPKLIPKAGYGISLWVHLLLEKFAAHHALGNVLDQLGRYDLALPSGTVTEGFRRITALLEPIYEAFLQRNARSVYNQADETRWLVFAEQEGKTGHRWWLWAYLGEDSVVFRIAPSRGHEVPEGHYPADAEGFLVVDRYSAYKAMVQVKLGNLLLVFCWAHVRRDFLAVGKGWPELAPWAIVWLQRIRELYHLNRQRLQHDPAAVEFQRANAALQEAVTAMHTEAIAELADPKLRSPCRKTLESLIEHWPGLARFVDDPKLPMDNNASERTLRGPAMGRKNYYGSGSLWSVCLTAAMFSILATLKRWGLNPRRWLTWYLESCAAAGGKPPGDFESFLPWNLSDQCRQQLANRPSPGPQPDTS
jgi:transposase